MKTADYGSNMENFVQCSEVFEVEIIDAFGASRSEPGLPLLGLTELHIRTLNSLLSHMPEQSRMIDR